MLIYAGVKALGVWVAVWHGLSGAATGAALILGWRYRQEQPGGWWSWLGLLWACGLLLLVGAAAVSGLAGVQEGFIAALDSANGQIARLPGVLDDLNVAVPVGVAGAVAALGGIGVLVPLGRSPLPDHSTGGNRRSRHPPALAGRSNVGLCPARCRSQGGPASGRRLGRCRRPGAVVPRRPGRRALSAVGVLPTPPPPGVPQRWMMHEAGGLSAVGPMRGRPGCLLPCPWGAPWDTVWTQPGLRRRTTLGSLAIPPV